MFDEEWRVHPWCDSRYLISNFGGVIRRDFIDKRGIYHCEVRLNPGIGNLGYYVLYSSFNGKNVGKVLHRLVADLFVPNPRGLNEVNHIDGNKKNSISSNLEWCTHRENMEHAIKTGLFVPKIGFKSGNECAASKLNSEKVKEIKELINKGEKDSSIAKMFGVVSGTIGHIRSGNTWSSVI